MSFKENRERAEETRRERRRHREAEATKLVEETKKVLKDSGQVPSFSSRAWRRGSGQPRSRIYAEKMDIPRKRRKKR